MDKEKEVKSFVDDFEEWNNVTGALAKGTGWYYECLSILEDADKALKAERTKREEAEKDNRKIRDDLYESEKKLDEAIAVLKMCANRSDKCDYSDIANLTLLSFKELK